jgi:polyhydroxyalkanoate synthase subunit PhaC
VQRGDLKASENLLRGPHPLALHLHNMWAQADSPAAVQQALAGVRAYQRHAAQRALSPLPVVARSGRATLLDAGGAGPPAVLVPSLVNPSWILDLDVNNSLLRWLSEQGVRALLVDWGEATSADAQLSLLDYVQARLLPLLRSLGEPVALMGYCLGGLLTLAMAQAVPSAVARLSLVATPWDFHRYPDRARADLGALWQRWHGAAQTLGVLPMDALQSAFASLDPSLSLKKFQRFATLDPSSADARAFVMLEDWANSGPPLSLAAARDCFDGLYRDNGTVTGAWGNLRPERLPMPVQCLTSVPDRLVPAAASEPLAARIPTVWHERVGAGHVGMIAGSKARTAVWTPLARFLRGEGRA